MCRDACGFWYAVAYLVTYGPPIGTQSNYRYLTERHHLIWRSASSNLGGAGSRIGPHRRTIPLGMIVGRCNN